MNGMCVTYEAVSEDSYDWNKEYVNYMCLRWQETRGLFSPFNMTIYGASA